MQRRATKEALYVVQWIKCIWNNSVQLCGNTKICFCIKKNELIAIDSSQASRQRYVVITAVSMAFQSASSSRTYWKVFLKYACKFQKQKPYSFTAISTINLMIQYTLQSTVLKF